MKTIKLYGELGKTFGRTFKFDVKTPAEAIRMLQANFKNFAEYLTTHSEPGYHVFVSKTNIGETDLTNPISDKDVIKIVPVIVGAGNNPWVRIIVGAAIIYFSGGLASGAVAAGMTGATAGTFVAIGASLVLGGVSQLLFAPPEVKMTQDQGVTNAPSYSFDGSVNTTRQGNPVSVGYGRLRVGSQVISAGLFTEAI